MTTALSGYRDLRGNYHIMRPDCDRANAAIFAERVRTTEDEMIAADIDSEEPRERDSFVKWIAIGAVMSLGAVAAGLAAHILRWS
jgi:hypothetical protein